MLAEPCSNGVTETRNKLTHAYEAALLFWKILTRILTNSQTTLKVCKIMS